MASFLKGWNTGRERIGLHRALFMLEHGNEKTKSVESWVCSTETSSKATSSATNVQTVGMCIRMAMFTKGNGVTMSSMGTGSCSWITENIIRGSSSMVRRKAKVCTDGRTVTPTREHLSMTSVRVQACIGGKMAELTKVSGVTNAWME